MRLPFSNSPWRPIETLRELGPVGPLAAFMVAGPLLGALVLLSTSRDWLDRLAGMGAVGAIPCFLVATIVLAGLCLIPTHAASLVAGLLFGVGGGIVLALAGSAGAALLGYLVLSRLARGRIMRLLETRPRAAAVRRALVARRTRVAGLIALIRLSPVMPFAATNLVMATAGVGLREFLAGSVLGMAPRVIVVVMGGAGLAELDLTRGTDARLAVIGGLATLIALIAIGRVSRAALRDAVADPTGATPPARRDDGWPKT